MESFECLLEELKRNENAMKMYIVYYTEGEYNSLVRINLFATQDKDSAEDYVERFNASLRKWQEYYGAIIDKYNSGELNVEDDSIVFDRYFEIAEINGCEIDEVEMR